MLVALSLLFVPLKAYAAATSTQVGNASFYSHYEDGRKTASGERYNPSLLTAASKTFPIGTVLKIINIKNGNSVIVRVNDKGPYVRSRVIDLSECAARCLGMLHSGVARVKIVVVIPKRIHHYAV
jgi:rare lipoprotein A